MHPRAATLALLGCRPMVWNNIHPRIVAPDGERALVLELGCWQVWHWGTDREYYREVDWEFHIDAIWDSIPEAVYLRFVHLIGEHHV